MKKIYIVFLMCAMIGGCNGHNKQSAAVPRLLSVIVVADVTDKKLLWPTATPILQSFHCDTSPDAACRFTLQVISDKKTNQSFSAFLSDGATTEKENRNDEAQFRKKAIFTFYETVQKAYADFYMTFDTTQSLQHSECWATICNALQQLSEDSSKQRKLILYTDLQERSSTGDAYKGFLTMSSEAIAQQLEKACAVPQQLNGVEVVIVYLPYDRVDDIRFNKMVAAYKVVLEKNAVIVKVQSTNTCYE